MTTTSDGRPLFRPEAVEHHARGRADAKPLDLGEGRTSWAFRVLVAVVAVALVVAFTVHADVSARGTGTVDIEGRTATLLLPAGALRRLDAGQRFRLDLAGGAVHGRVLRVGRPAAGAGGVLVPVFASLDEVKRPGAQGVAVVRLGHPTLAALLLGGHGG
jgi:hypothetical protein